MSLSARQKLRDLLDTLHERYKHMDEHAESLDGDISGFPSSESGFLSSFHQHALRTSNTLSELQQVVDHEAKCCKAYLGRLENASKPAFSLPFELLTRIFTLVCFSPVRTYYGDPGPLQPFANPAERSTLAEVCHRWRQVVLDSSVFWKHIRIGNGHRNVLHHLPLQIFRSGGSNTPLSFEYNGYLAGGKLVEPHWDVVKLYIVEQRDRLFSLELRANGANPGEVLGTSSFPFLRFLKLNIRMTSDIIQVNLGSLPSLSFLHLYAWTSYIEGYATTHAPQIVLAGDCKLSELHLSGRLSARNALDLITRQAENLEVLEWARDWPPGMFWDLETSDFPEVVFPKLRSFSLESNSTLCLLVKSSFPNVTSLKLKMCGHEDPSWAFSDLLGPSILTTRGRMFPRLHQLLIDGSCRIAPIHARNFLRNHPTLEDIDVYNIGNIWPGQPGSNVHEDLGPHFLPKLRRLRSEGYWNPNQVDLLLTISAARASPFVVFVEENSVETEHLRRAWELQSQYRTLLRGIELWGRDVVVG